MKKIMMIFLASLTIVPCAQGGLNKFLRETKRVMKQTGHGLGKVVHAVENGVLEPVAHAIENEVVEPAANGFNDHVIKPACKGFSKGVHKEVTEKSEEFGKVTVQAVIQKTAEYLQSRAGTQQQEAQMFPAATPSLNDRKRPAPTLPFEPDAKRRRK